LSRIAHLPNGARLRLPDGGDVSLAGGNVYLIRGANRDAVCAEVNTGSPDWINLSVGLNRWPIVEHGLLANAGINVSAVEARDGTVLTAPFPINDFYGHYGNSWRVPASQSLLFVCGRKVVSGNPTAPFYASDLPPGLAKQARAICLDAHVRGSAARRLHARCRGAWRAGGGQGFPRRTGERHPGPDHPAAVQRTRSLTGRGRRGTRASTATRAQATIRASSALA
jgi:hypothetical protein